VVFSEVNFPQDLKKLNPSELNELALQIREYLNTHHYGKSGHIKASMGVVELTIALHRIFDTPADILIWDVGHQAYIHKLLTGRKGQFPQKRKKGGISGFTSSKESVYDPFGAGHSSTSVSALAGFAEAARLSALNRKHIAVIGDGAFTGGMNFEAMNYAGERELDVLVVLNDNQMSIDQNVGALNRFSTYARFCESLNFDFLGTVDGHDLDALLNSIRDAADQTGPRLLRVLTQKGRGYKALVSDQPEPVEPSFQQVVAEQMLAIFEANEKVVLLSPAMLSGGHFLNLREKYPQRVFDVGIAEQHAVTMAAGMAASGYKPYVHLYSTFSQRALDQIIHDVVLQNLPVTFLLDRAGLVGEDGATHHGVFDISTFSALPEINILAPSDKEAVKKAIDQSLNSPQPTFIRYPKDVVSQSFKGSGFYRSGEHKLVISYGSISAEVEAVAATLGYGHMVVQQLRPLHFDGLAGRFAKYNKAVVVEESPEGFGLAALLRQKLSKSGIEIDCKSIGLPDAFIEHASRSELLEASQLKGEGLKQALLNA